MIATTLFVLGETQKAYINKLQSDISDAIDERKEEASPRHEASSKFGDTDQAWQLSLEQIMATILVDPLLSEFFTVRHSLKDIVAKNWRKKSAD
ncbi:hypothetical protein AAVH_02135 [Aphelenchoides avenae]|nr:hypothetical protein AAVH_02135 [Aphelenchus avenae]